jgi:hypothetical protein
MTSAPCWKVPHACGDPDDYEGLLPPGGLPAGQPEGVDRLFQGWLKTAWPLLPCPSVPTSTPWPWKSYLPRALPIRVDWEVTPGACLKTQRPTPKSAWSRNHAYLQTRPIRASYLPGLGDWLRNEPALQAEPIRVSLEMILGD